ncbi:MAG TPA: hypothetical protein VHP11_07120 [Tepidisphaeraceae bacterium]|nr:hypothetical protein [Tepidisphaeraceae bacterium]
MSQIRGKAQNSSQPSTLPAPTPLKAQPKLLAILSIVFAAWIGFLLVLYFTTIHHS